MFCTIHSRTFCAEFDINSSISSLVINYLTFENSVFKQATIKCIPSSNNCNKKIIPIPGWNKYVREHHKIARDAFK